MSTAASSAIHAARVRCLRDVSREELASLLRRFSLALHVLPANADIPGSYWGAPEAGLVAATLYARADTPVHSVLHEAGHFICMTPARRDALDTDAGGDHAEENGVCYLQMLLADHVTGYSRAELAADMDRWGYSFRLGSAAAWFADDAADARAFLHGHGLIDARETPTWRLRHAP